MNLEHWLEKNIGFENFRPGLWRIQKALKLFELDFSDKKIVAVAGTNGKGQTARELYKLCLEESSCALWTSPHLVSVTERFSKNGKEIASQELEELCARAMFRLRKAELELSYYEFLFLAFLLFSRNERILVLEAGLGGRLDAVNALKADLVLLTSISRDHQEILGNRFDLILGEKIALAQDGAELATNFELKYLRQKTRAWCQEHGVQWTDLFEKGSCDKSFNFERRNKVLAFFGFCKIFNKEFCSPRFSSEGLLTFSFEGATCHAMPAHNPDGVRKGVQFLKDDKYTNTYNLVLMSFSHRSFEDAMSMIRMIKAWSEKEGIAQIVLTVFEHPKAMGQETLKALAQTAQVKFVNDKKELLEKYSIQGKTILALGSNYFIGALRGRGPLSRG